MQERIDTGTRQHGIFNALYRNNEIYTRIEGRVFHFLALLSGVLQGCPGSGSLFVTVVDPTG